MSENIILRNFSNTYNSHKYHNKNKITKRTFNLINNLSTVNSNHKNNRTNIINSRAKSISEVIKKMEILKKKNYQLNLQKIINSKIEFNRMLNLKKQYLKQMDIRSKTEHTLNPNKDSNKLNDYSSSLYKIENTDKISMINKSRNKNINLLIETINNFDETIYISKKQRIKLQKSNEIKYQINSEIKEKDKEKDSDKKNRNNFTIKTYKNQSEINNKSLRNEFLNLDKRINEILKNDIDKNSNDDSPDLINDDKKFSSIQSIKQKFCLLNDVKKEIKKMNKDSYEENEKTQNSSFDSQINLGFKHIKPVIKKEKFFEDYLKEDQPKKEKDTISKPILIRSLRRPKLNVPNFPSFFYK
jgi:hypothetical protein